MHFCGLVMLLQSKKILAILKIVRKRELSAKKIIGESIGENGL